MIHILSSGAQDCGSPRIFPARNNPGTAGSYDIVDIGNESPWKILYGSHHTGLGGTLKMSAN